VFARCVRADALLLGPLGSLRYLRRSVSDPFGDVPSRVPPTLPPPPQEGGGAGRTRRVIAVGGGRGGVGKTLLSVNLGVYFAQLGRDVVVCDADPFGSNLHAVLGLATPPLATPEDVEEGSAEPVATTVPGLRLLPTAFDPVTATPLRPSRRTHWTTQLARLDVDYVILNLGASMSATSLDLFLGADVGVCMAAPEPLAIETTYRFFRALYSRALRRALMKERYKLRLVERTVTALPTLASPREVVAALKRYDEAVASIAAYELARMAPRLVIGQTRLRSDLELGPAMAAVSQRFLGIALDYLGHIEHDDAVWLTVRRRRPLLIDSPTSKSARNLERVARRILALLAAQGTRGSDPGGAPRASMRAPAPDLSPATLYEVLGVPRTAADDEIRRAYKRQRDIFREGSLPVVSVVGEEVMREEQARIEEAYDTLLDPVRRRAYDLSTYPDEVQPSVAPARSNTAAAAELLMMQAELAREIDADTEFTGALLRKVRESQGVELSEIAQRTKISMPYLVAIEGEIAGDLPAPVYVHGFVQQLAKFLKLDPAQVSKTYLRRLRQVTGGRARG
jgi:flagellar biosynthesis protein FlhG